MKKYEVLNSVFFFSSPSSLPSFQLNIEKIIILISNNVDKRKYQRSESTLNGHKIHNPLKLALDVSGLCGKMIQSVCEVD